MLRATAVLVACMLGLGLAPLIADETTVIDIIAPWLTLDGLRLLYEMNQPALDTQSATQEATR